MLTRRGVLKSTLNGAALVALSPTVPTFLANTARAAGPRRDGRVLVVIQLDGGNDAINTLVPFRECAGQPAGAGGRQDPRCLAARWRQ